VLNDRPEGALLIASRMWADGLAQNDFLIDFISEAAGDEADPVKPFGSH
jgi:hypothetical protein